AAWSPTGSRAWALPGLHERLRLAIALLVVLVEAAAALRSEPAGEEHPPEQRRRGHARIAELVEEHVRDVVVDVHAGVVDELERSHRIAEPELHRLIDVLLRRDADLQHANC